MSETMLEEILRRMSAAGDDVIRREALAVGMSADEAERMVRESKEIVRINGVSLADLVRPK